MHLSLIELKSNAKQKLKEKKDINRTRDNNLFHILF